MNVKTVFKGFIVLVLTLLPITIQAKVLNPSFEQDDTYWECEGNDCPIYVQEYHQFAVTGTHYAAIYGTTSIYQDLHLPQQANRLGIIFHYWLNGQVNSSVQLKIIDQETNEVYLDKTTNQAFASEMKTQSYVLPETALGRNVRIQFNIIGEVYLDTIHIERTLGYPAMRAYITSWTGENDLSGARISVFDSSGKRLRLKNVKNKITSRSIVTNSTGATPLFRMLGVRKNNQAFSLCAKKGSIQGCTAITPPMAGKDYSINFSPDFTE